MGTDLTSGATLKSAEQGENLRVLCFWAWNGTMDYGEMKRQLKDFAEKGIGGVFIHSRAGLKIEYLSEDWFDAFGVAVEECAKLNLEVWIYDEDGWPSGFAGGKVFAASDDFKEKYLKSITVSAEECAKLKNIIALYKETEQGYKLIAAEKDINNITLSGEYIAVYATINPVYIDILNYDAVKYFINVTHEEYKKRFNQHFGKTIKGIFTDEPHFSPNGLPWGKYTERDFFNNNGYSIYDALPYMFYKKGDYRVHRYNFWKNISYMMQNSYCKPYYEWCCKNGLDFTGHYACEEGQIDQISTNGGVMPLYQYQHIAGVDSLGNRLAPLPIFKQAEAVAWQLNNKKVLCETYACSGYDSTFSDILWIWGYQATMGVNIPCLSISMYSLTGTRKRDYPTFFSYQMPWWKNFNKLCSFIDFINNKMHNSNKEDGILLIHPKTSIWCEKGSEAEIEEKKISSDFRVLTEALVDLQKSFDYGDEDILANNFKICERKLSVGKVKYNTVIVPPMCNIEKSTLDIIREFSRYGGKVIFINELPVLIGAMPAQKNSFDFEKICLTLRIDMLRKYFVCNESLPDIELIDCYTRRTALGFCTAVRICEGDKFMLAVNRAREEKRNVRVRVNGENQIIKETIDGRKLHLECNYDEHNDVTYADIQFDEQEVCFITTCAEKSLKQPKSAGEFVQISSKSLSGFGINIGENSLVIDKVCYKIDDGEFSEEDYAIFTTPNFYSKINGIDKDVLLTMKYNFTVKQIPDGTIALVCEDDGAQVLINGLSVNKAGWHIDREFGRFDITDKIKIGVNEVLLIKKIKKFKFEYDLNKVFQTVTNVFSYEYYIENIYIFGKFDVKEVERGFSGENCHWINSKGCEIEKFHDKNDLSDLTNNNLFYFNGTIVAEKVLNIDIDKGEKILLSYDKPNFVTANLFINDKFVSSIGVAPFNHDITTYLNQGENNLKLEIFSSARNLFGPHHHIKGRHNYVGHTVFKGYTEFEDPVVFPEISGKNTWTDDISVAPLGIKNLRLTTLKRKS